MELRRDDYINVCEIEWDHGESVVRDRFLVFFMERYVIVNY